MVTRRWIETSTCLVVKYTTGTVPIVTTRNKTGWFSIYTTLDFEVCQARD